MDVFWSLAFITPITPLRYLSVITITACIHICRLTVHIIVTRVTYDFRNIMRITAKIYFKRFKKVTRFAGGCLLSLLWLEFTAPEEIETG